MHRRANVFQVGAVLVEPWGGGGGAPLGCGPGHTAGVVEEVGAVRGGRGQLLHVGADGFRQAEARSGSAPFQVHDGPLDEPGDAACDLTWVARRSALPCQDGLGGLQREAADEHPEGAHDVAFAAAQQGEAPVQRGAHGLLPGVRGALPTPEDLEPALQAIGDGLEAEQHRAGRGQLDRERDAVEPPADVGDHLDLVRVGDELGVGLRRPRHEQVDRACAAGGAVGDGERRDAVDPLAEGAQRLLAGHDDVECGRAVQEGFDGGGDGREHAFAAVEEEEAPPFAHQVGDVGDGGPERQVLQAQRAGDGGQDEVGVAQQGQVGHAEVGRVSFRQGARGGAGQPGLANAAGSREGQEAVFLLDSEDVAQVGVAAEQGVDALGGGAWRGLGRAAGIGGGGGGGGGLLGDVGQDAVDGSNEAVATARDGLDVARVRLPGAEDLAQGRDVDAEVALVDVEARPDDAEQLVLADHVAAPLHEGGQDVERPPADGQGRPGCGQLAAGGIEQERSKGIGGTLPLPRRAHRRALAAARRVDGVRERAGHDDKQQVPRGWGPPGMADVRERTLAARHAGFPIQFASALIEEVDQDVRSMVGLKLLEAFYWVARLKGFHAAAAQLNVSQPSISYRVKELEQRLGRVLLVRGGQDVRLTAQGQALLAHAERIIGAAQAMQQEFSAGGAPTGPIRIGVNDAFAAVCLPHLLRRMAADHPAVEVAVVVDTSHALTSILDRGELDVAVVSTPPLLAGLRFERLGQQRVAWIGGPGEARAPAEDLAWVTSARVFVTPPPSNLDGLTNDWFRGVNLVPPRLSLCNSVSAIVGLVQAGSGVAILPVPLVASGLAAGSMRRLGLPGELPPQTMFVAFDKGVLGGRVWNILGAIRAVVAAEGFCEAEAPVAGQASPAGADRISRRPRR